MKVVILAAWQWTRLKPLTNTIPKPLIKICWKSIIEHNLESLRKFATEIVIVVKYLEDEIINKLWNNYKWIPIKYHKQWDEKWTGAAIKNMEGKVGDLIIMVWDQIFLKEDIKKVIKLKWYGGLVTRVKQPEKYGIFKENDKGFAEKVIEKPKKFIWDLANISFYKINSEIFELIKSLKVSIRWEIEITDAINLFIKKHNYKLIEWKFIDVWYPWDILNANKYFLDKLKKSKIKGKKEKNVVIKWNVIVEKGTILKSWTYIEWNCYIWKDSIIWPNCYIRWNTVIWNNCKVWNAVEIKNSSLWDNTNVAHLSYIWDSIIWNNVNIWWWFMVANLRHDEANIKVPVKWELTDTWLKKFWCVIWNNVKTWMWTKIYPGRVIENDSLTIPGEIVK